MAPVDEFKVRPAGNEGETDQVTTAPPPTVGVDVVMATPLVSV